MTAHDRTVPLDSGSQRISCSITGLSGAANVKWYNPSGSEITSGQGSYTIIDGKSSYTTGSQTTFLEIGTPVLQAMTTIDTYKCGITSGVSTTSAESKSDVVVTPIGQLSTKVAELVKIQIGISHIIETWQIFGLDISVYSRLAH